LLDSVRGDVIILGRRCFEEINGAFPGAAATIILSRNPDCVCPGATAVCHSLGAALERAAQVQQARTIWIGGGTAIYAEAFPVAQRLHLTHIHRPYQGDTYFPEGWREFFPVAISQREARDEAHALTFAVYGKQEADVDADAAAAAGAGELVGAQSAAKDA